MVEPSLKEVVKAMCKAYPGGREAMAGALGMSVTQFNNNLYEKNGCRFFEVNELEAMEDISNTSLGGLLCPSPWRAAGGRSST